MWKTLLQRVKAATLKQIRKVPPGIRKAIAYKLVRHIIGGIGWALGTLGWVDSNWIAGTAGLASFVAAIGLSVLDAYLVDDKITAAASQSP